MTEDDRVEIEETLKILQRASIVIVHIDGMKIALNSDIINLVIEAAEAGLA